MTQIVHQGCQRNLGICKQDQRTVLYQELQGAISTHEERIRAAIEEGELAREARLQAENEVMKLREDRRKWQ